MRLLLSARQHGWHPAAWRVSKEAPFSAAALLDTARKAEEAMLDGVLFGLPALAEALPGGGPSDSKGAEPRLDPLPVMGAAIARTGRIGLAAYWPLDMAEPYHVARVMATLDHLSGGRAAWITGLSGRASLGADYGHATLLEDEEAVRRALEFVEVAVELWDSWEDRGFVADQKTGLFADPDHVHPILHDGPFFAVRGPLNVPRPVQGRPVIIHRDNGPGPLRQAAISFADVILASCPTLEAATALKKELSSQAIATMAARPPLLLASIMPVLAPTEGEARRRADALDRMAVCTAPRFVGTPDGFAAELARWTEAGACDGFDLRPAVLSPDLDLIREEVMPLLGQQSLRPAHDAGRTFREHLGLERPASQYAA
jgi:alkanesulfonate monooxygenase SsuD/methylene tetrahydromethanopterin reductase-like flavin-dependent oxidoreductase (luciferase family)